MKSVLNLSGGFNPHLVPLNPQVFIDPPTGQKYIADPL